MERDGHASAILVLVALMAAALAMRAKRKGVPKEVGYDFAGGEAAEQGVVDGHASDSYRNPFIGEYRNVFFGSCGNGNTVLAQLIDDDLNDFLNVLCRFLAGGAPRGRPEF